MLHEFSREYCHRQSAVDRGHWSGIVKIKYRRGGGGRSGRIRVIDVVRRGRKMNGTKETRGGGAERSLDESEREREREGDEEDWTTLGEGKRVDRK